MVGVVVYTVLEKKTFYSSSMKKKTDLSIKSLYVMLQKVPALSKWESLDLKLRSD